MEVHLKVVSFLSQKGGVAKSTLARAVATESSRGGASVKLADLDTQQGTSADWHRLRLDNGFDAVASVEIFSKAEQVANSVQGYDLLVVDGAPRASVGTLAIAKMSDLVVLPTCTSRDDLAPAIKLYYELEKAGIPSNSIAFALVRVSTEAEVRDAKEYFENRGVNVLDGCLYEKPAYRLAQDKGLSISETPYRSVNEKAMVLLESIVDHLLKE